MTYGASRAVTVVVSDHLSPFRRGAFINWSGALRFTSTPRRPRLQDFEFALSSGVSKADEYVIYRLAVSDNFSAEGGGSEWLQSAELHSLFGLPLWTGLVLRGHRLCRLLDTGIKFFSLARLLGEERFYLFDHLGLAFIITTSHRANLKAFLKRGAAVLAERGGDLSYISTA